MRIGAPPVNQASTATCNIYVYKYSTTLYFSVPDMKFNSTTLYPILYISDDDTVITNRKTPYTSRVSSGPSHLHRYTGVLMNKKLSMEENIYFEVKTTYESLLGQDLGLLFEIGFIDQSELDKNIYLERIPGTIFVRVQTCKDDKGYICLEGHDGRTVYQSFKLSLMEEYEEFDVRFGFYINPDEDVIRVTYSFDNNKIPDRDLYTFEEAGISDSMWPVFALYNPHKFEIHMELVNAKGLLFDSSTVHPMIYISDNGLEISNVATKTTRRVSYRDGQLQKYEGAIGDISFENEKTKYQKWPKKAQFRVLVEYNITRNVYATYLFEIGLSRLKDIDKSWSVGSHRYSISVFGHSCDNYKKVCLCSERDGIRKIVSKLSSSQVGTQFKGIITFLIDFSDRTVTITSDYSTVIFDNVDFTEPMWPVFALYKHIVDSKMAINKTFERSWKDKLSFWLSSLFNSVQRV